MPIIMGLLIATGFCILAGYGLYQFTVNGSNYSTYVFFRLFCIPYVKIFPLLVVLIAPFAFFYFVRLDDLYDKTPMMIATYIWIGTFILIGLVYVAEKNIKL